MLKLCIFRAKLLLFTASLFYAIQANAYSNTDTILLLDASGSMWGQIDGVNKIVIAKDVVEGLVRSLPATQRLGFVAYGHRNKGDCSDIETLADVGASRESVIESLRGLNPRGMTPLSRSIERAATELNYKKHAATVILVSDGLETCDVDPCALAKTLEENGLDLTVHVAGFDVTEQERKGLVCIAAETGGSFVAARNADELAEALINVSEVVSSPIQSEPVPATVALKATILSGGPLIQSKLNWALRSKSNSEIVHHADDTGSATFDVPPGEYVVDVSWSGWRDGSEPKVGRAEFTVKSQQPKVVTVPIDLDLPVTLRASATTAEGTPFEVSWSGPDDLGAYIHVAGLEDGPRDFIYMLDATKVRAANQKINEDTNGDGAIDHLDLVTSLMGAPSIAGNYEVRYVLNQPRLVLARQALTVTDTPYSIEVPAQVVSGAPFDVQWGGIATDGDFVTIIAANSDKVFENGRVARLSQGRSASLIAPPEAGEYEVRYILANGYTTYPGMQHAIQARASLRVVAAGNSLSAPESAVGGSTISINWQDEIAGWEDDVISIVEAGAAKSNRMSQISLNRASAPKQVNLRVPSLAGEYEAVYVLHPGGKIISRTPITVSAAAASVDAPDTVKVGESFEVAYQGQGFAGDRVVVVPADTPDSKMWGITVRYGFSADSKTNLGIVTNYPIQSGPGEYEARYVTGVDHIVLARDRFKVVE